MSTERPLILATNDDGIRSPGLLASAEALAGLGEVLVVAPQEQQSGTGRAIIPSHPGKPVFVAQTLTVAGREIQAYAVNGTPSMAVLYGLLALAPRRPRLVVSGINYGENLGTDVLTSGTLGAALEAADMGIRALAVSFETPKELHFNNSVELDLEAAMHFLRLFAGQMLDAALPPDVDVLKVDVPDTATAETPWRLTRQWPRRYHRTFVHPDSPPGGPGRLDYDALQSFEGISPASDVWALRVDRVVSVTPLSLDLTSRVSLPELDALLRADPERFGSLCKLPKPERW